MHTTNTLLFFILSFFFLISSTKTLVALVLETIMHPIEKKKRAGISGKVKANHNTAANHNTIKLKGIIGVKEEA